MIRQTNTAWETLEHDARLLTLLPENDAMENLPTELWETLTPLEKLVIWWHFTRGGLLVVQMQLFSIFGNISYEHLLDVWHRKPVRDICKKVRKLNPFLCLYSADYFVELIHEEVELLRARTRIVRNIANKEQDSLDWRKNEREDVQTLIKCLELIQKLTEVKKDGESANAGDVSSRINGVISQAEKLIEASNNRDDAADQGSTTDTP